MSKRTIALDFDGVVHSYVTQWQGAEVIPDPPVAGSKEAIQALRDQGFEVVVFSTRCATAEGREAVELWLIEHEIPVGHVSASKPPALVYVDDRAVRFNGDWSVTLEDIKAAITKGTWQGKATGT